MIPHNLMQNIRLMLLLVFLVPAAAPALAGSLVLRIQAINPKDTTQTVSIRSNLPQRVGPDDVVDTAGLEIGYDIRHDIYFVHGNVEVGPSKVISYDVKIKDIWIIPEEEISMLRQRAEDLRDKLKDTKHAVIAEAAKEQIKKGLDQIEAKQIENAIKPGNAIKHINAYEVNLDTLDLVMKDVGHLENLVLNTGGNPGRLVGADKTAAPPDRHIMIAPKDYNTAVISITVSNPSPTEVRKLPGMYTPRFMYDLPPEITIDDVLDTDGLELAMDTTRGVCYVYHKGLEIAPTSSLTFLVKIRDKWNLNKPRIPPLLSTASNLLAVVSAKGMYDEIEKTLLDLIVDAGEIEKEEGPGTLNAAYVAFYRHQAKRLDVIEMEINRIRAALKPMSQTTRLGFKAKAPSMKTTWMIIYIILGFLAVMSLLFFLRWYGKSKDEQIGKGGS